MRASRISQQNRLRQRSRIRIYRAPARETAGQYLQRQNRGRDAHEAFVGFLRASRRRSFFEKQPEFVMRFDELPQPGFPQDVRQAGITMQFVITFDQALTLRRQAPRQEAEIEVLSLAGARHAGCLV